MQPIEFIIAVLWPLDSVCVHWDCEEWRIHKASLLVKLRKARKMFSLSARRKYVSI